MDYLLSLVPIFSVSLILAASCFIVLRAGELSFGQQAYFGIGAYACGILTAMFQWPLVAAVAVSTVAAAALACASGLAALRMTGFQFSLFTLVFAEFVREALARFEWRIVVDGRSVGPEGPLGFSGIEYLRENHYSVTEQAVLMLAIAAVVVAWLHLIERGSLGRAVDATAADREMAESVGIRTARVRLAAFTLAGAVAGLGGALFALTATYVDAANFGLMMGVHALAYTLMGGLATIFGPVLGTAVDIVFLEGLRVFGGYRMVAFGSLLVLVLILRPQGLLGARRPTHPREPAT